MLNDPANFRPMNQEDGAISFHRGCGIDGAGLLQKPQHARVKLCIAGLACRSPGGTPWERQEPQRACDCAAGAGAVELPLRIRCADPSNQRVLEPVHLFVREFSMFLRS